ncbi:MAG: hypothetical protein AAF969_13040 [Bacteroidota bacterium]
MKLSKNNKYLLLGFLLLLFSSYYFAVRKTLDLKKKLHVIQDEQKNFESAHLQFSQLLEKERNLDRELANMNLDNTSLQNNLLKFLNAQGIKNEFAIKEFNAPHIAIDANSETTTYMFVLEGGYLTLLTVIHKLENHGGFGNVSHVGFEKIKNFSNNTFSLQAIIYLESVQ